MGDKYDEEYVRRQDSFAAEASDDISHAYQDGYDAGYNDGYQAGEHGAVRHGCWEASYMDGFLVCSECGHYWIYKGDQYDYRYCPNCGALMDAGEREPTITEAEVSE